MRCGKIEYFLSLQKRNRLPQPHASNADHVNQPLPKIGKHFKIGLLGLSPTSIDLVMDQRSCTTCILGLKVMKMFLYYDEQTFLFSMLCHTECLNALCSVNLHCTLYMTGFRMSPVANLINNLRS